MQGKGEGWRSAFTEKRTEGRKKISFLRRYEGVVSYCSRGWISYNEHRVDSADTGGKRGVFSSDELLLLPS